MGDFNMKHVMVALILSSVPLTAAMAQFTGPSAATNSRPSVVAAVSRARPGSYFTLTGNIVSHQRLDYFLFRDATGEIRVEISSPVFAGRAVTPETRVRLVGEVDVGLAGRYVWVQSLEILP
jgi:uncharacterized protein (TIGR00156 family)